MKARLRLPTRIRAKRHRLLLGGLAFLLISLGCLWATGVATSTPLFLARQALWRRDNEQAHRWVLVARWLDPTNAEAAFLLARIERRAERFDEAAAHLRSAETLGMDPARVRREKMLALAQTGELDLVEEQINHWMVTADSVERREICEAYANGLAKLARFAHLERLLNAWRTDFPEDPQPDYRMGRVYEHLRQMSDAEQYYRAALKKDARYHPAAFALARILLDRKEVEDALALYRQCAELPRNAAAKVGMGQCLKALGKVDEARRLFQQAALVGEDERAASYRAVGESAERFLAAVELGKLESETGRLQEAERWLRAALDSNPRDLVARYAWAVALRGLGRREEAEREFEHVRVSREALEEAGKLHDHIDQHPDDVEARYQLGCLILEHDSERVGLYWLGTALQYDPHHAPSHRALAEYFAQKAGESPANRRLAEYHRSQAGLPAAAR